MRTQSFRSRHLTLFTCILFGFVTVEAACSSSARGPAGVSSSSAVEGGPASLAKSPVIGNVDLPSNPNTALGLPGHGSLPEIVISRGQYVLSWNNDRRVMNWAAWRLRAADIGSSGRTDDFKADPDLADYLESNDDGEAVGPQDYQRTCLDRGHQVPSGDRTDTAANNRATFLMSNIMPQSAYLNRTTWEHLESHERALVHTAEASTALYVMAGPVYDHDAGTIGPDDDISVPTGNFKIIAQKAASIEGQPEARPKILVAVIMPNLTSAGTDPLTDHDTACEDQKSLFEGVGDHDVEDWDQYKVSVATIEQRTGLDLGFLE